MAGVSDDFREEIMAIYDLPESLRESWRAIWRRGAVTTPFPDFPGMITYLLGEGHKRNPCQPHCPDHGDPDHAHLRTKDGEDVIVWADGTVSYFDLTQPARLIYPSLPRSAYPAPWRPGGPCYPLPSGNTAHVKPGCRC